MSILHSAINPYPPSTGFLANATRQAFAEIEAEAHRILVNTDFHDPFLWTHTTSSRIPQAGDFHSPCGVVCQPLKEPDAFARF